MTSFFLLLKDDPLWGSIVALTVFLLYIWREQAKIKARLETVAENLDDKKLDKEDFLIYNKSHNDVHKGIMDHLKMAIELLKEKRRG